MTLYTEHRETGKCRTQLSKDGNTYTVHDHRIIIYKKGKGFKNWPNVIYKHNLSLCGLVIGAGALLLFLEYMPVLTVVITLLCVSDLIFMSLTSELRRACVESEGHSEYVKRLSIVAGDYAFSVAPSYCSVPYALLKEYTELEESDPRRVQLEYQMSEYLV